MANTYSQVNIHAVFTVQGRENVLNKELRGLGGPKGPKRPFKIVKKITKNYKNYIKIKPCLPT